MRFYDTNAVLNLQEKILDDKFFISSVTLHELEHIKTSKTKDEEVKYKARKAVHLLDENIDKYEVIIYDNRIKDILDRLGLEENPDNEICACAKYALDEYNSFSKDNDSFSKDNDFCFITDDICCRVIASIVFGLNCKSAIVDDINEKYKGYIEVKMSEYEMATFYEHQNENTYELNINEYIIIKDDTDKVVDVRKWDGTCYTAVIAKSFKSSTLGTIKPLDEVQQCAMDSIASNDITVLYGKAGNGKTLLPLSYIMQNIEKGKIRKCYIIYSFEPLKNAQTLGFEKGEHSQKLLYYSSIGNILSSKFGDIQEVQYLMEKNVLDIIPTANIRGVEFGEDDCVLCTEAQNLDVYTLKTIIQRCKSGCKQIYEGDIIEQKDTNITKVGIDRLIEVFKGNNKFGCVKLKNNYRSELCELADLM